MVSSSAKEIFIQGLTLEGKTFRPSDWADRLCGVMSQFRPGGPQPGSHLTYSPWCVPTLIGDVKCVVVNSELREAEPMAWDFALNFAKDNRLQVVEACLLHEAPKAPPKLDCQPVAREDMKKPPEGGFFTLLQRTLQNGGCHTR